MKTSRVVILLTCLVLVAACGTKGDLVLPGKETPARTVDPIDLPGDADASKDQGDTGEPADAAEPAAPPTEE
jgi:predicted small lipoprotein YifL